ncbi:hypothetical protein [Mesorhizobium sp. GbtcB19]|uniref:hypothetical protein n=1 Tax=Mesorhizobium sp. GbtcB19 TaxID=2824764 RepID=UPI001C303A38|nr:hypothetical protein [Mesorhizobium sp. GbtcB19]
MSEDTTPKKIAATETCLVAQAGVERRRVGLASGRMVSGFGLTWHDYESDGRLTTEDLAGLSDEIHRAMRLKADTVKQAASQRLLIAGGLPGDRPHEVPLLTVQQYEALHGGWPCASELDRTCVLIKDYRGNYLSKTAFYHAIPVDHRLSATARRDARDRKFVQEMDALGLSSMYFGACRPAVGEERMVQTPAGVRQYERVFEYPLQAGVTLPDMLLRDRDGIHIGIYPKLDPDIGYSSLKVIQEKFGACNVWLKTADNSYETVETMNERKPNSAEQALAAFNCDQLPIPALS